MSTDNEDQTNSLASQKKYFADYIERNQMWDLIEIYVDEGITGTSTKKRHSFNRMIADAQNKKFDLIITKEISRFARNTLDSIYYTRKLKELGIGVFFMNDNINTLDPDSELRLTIMSSIAQEESRKTSERVKWGQKRRMEQGVVFGRDMLGYDVKDGKLAVNEDGAEIVRLIFHKFVSEGKGTYVIARELREAGIQTSTYMKQWSNTVILRVLRNEKYCGDLIQKKTFTPSYLNHEKKYNRGEEEFVVIENHHEPIISRELFDKAQRELARRSPDNEQKAKYSNRYCFSGKIKCGNCGSSYVSRTKKLKDGSTYKAWRCFEATKNGNKHIDNAGNEAGCNNHSINENNLKLIMQQVVKNLMINKEEIIESLCSAVKKAISTNADDNRLIQLQNKINTATQKKQSLIELYLNKEISKTDLHDLTSKYETEIANLEKEYKALKQNQELLNEQDNILNEIEKIIRTLSCGDEWDDIFYRNIIDKIVVKENNELDIYLKMLPDKLNYIAINSKKLKADWGKAPLEIKECICRQFESSLGTEELAHMEMVSAMVYQLTRDLSIDEIKKSGFENYFVDHTTAVYPIASSSPVFTATYFQSKGDVIADLHEDLAAEQKARVVYDNILRLVDDPDIRDPIKFLREREIVHYQRFGEGLRLATDKLNEKNFYAFNPSFDKGRR